MSPMATKPTELDELEAQLRNALRREVAPASLAQAVEARMHLVKTEQQAPVRAPPMESGGG